MEKKYASAYETPKILQETPEIPVTNLDWSEYVDRLWGDYLKVGENKTNIEKGILARVSEHPELYIADIGAGKSESMITLNDLLIARGLSPIAYRVDPTYGTNDQKTRFSQNDKQGDIYDFPFENESCQLVISNEVLSYLLRQETDEEKERYKTFLAFRQRGALVRQLDHIFKETRDARDAQDFKFAQDNLDAFQDNLPEDFFLTLQYDLDMFNAFCKESARVLSTANAHTSEFRVYPFCLQHLFRFTSKQREIGFGDREYNEKRAQQFLEIVRRFNSVECHFYDQTIMEDQAKLQDLQTQSTAFKKLIEENLSPEIVEALKKILDFNDPLCAENGLLVFKK